MHLRSFFVLGLTAGTLVGCASVPMGDPQRDAELKTFSAPHEKAAIYVYRNESMGGAVKMPVILDGKILGDTAAKTYLYSEVEPGHHQLVSKAENDSTLDVDTVAGKIYYVWQEVKMGIMYARSKLQLVDDTTGRDGVKESKLTVLKSDQADAAK
ncbi:lipoprotein [Burkholderia sp. A9]|nr:lipoprotein [Burkholderia sp. A9]